MRQNVNAYLHFNSLALVLCALNNRFEYISQLVAEEDRNDSRRSLARTESVVVACCCNRCTQDILMLVDSLYDSRKHEQELCVLSRCFARLEKINASVCRKRPVIVLARTVDALERLFVQQALEAVLSCSTLHYLHCQLVVVGSDVYRVIDWSKLVLSRCDLVVLGLGIDAQSPQLLVKVLHVCGNSCLDSSEIVVIKLLTLWCRCAEKSPACKDKVFSVRIHLSVDEEILLLGTCVCDDSCCVRAEQLEHSQCRLVDSVYRAQQRSFLVQCLAAV